MSTPSSATESSSAWIEICGNRSASKKSGDWRWPASCSSFTSTLATRADPARVGAASVAVEVAEAAAEGVDAGVLDLEHDVRVDKESAAQVVPAGAIVVDSKGAHLRRPTPSGRYGLYLGPESNYSEERLSSQVLTTQEIFETSALPDGAWVRFLRAHAALTRELSSRLEAFCTS